MILGGGNSNIFYVHPETGEDEPILTSVFQMGWFNHQLDDGKGRRDDPLLFGDVVCFLLGASCSTSRAFGRNSGITRCCFQVGFFSSFGGWFLPIFCSRKLDLHPRKLTWRWKLHHEWRCISYWKMGGFSNVMCVFRGEFFNESLQVSKRNQWYQCPGLPPPLKYWLTQFRWLKPLGNQWWLY